MPKAPSPLPLPPCCATAPNRPASPWWSNTLWPETAAFLRVDGALLDIFKLPHGYWEAKDTKDDLEKEIQKKFDAGYPKDNILFQAPHRAIIYQDGRPYFNEDISRPEALIEALQNFFAYQPPHFEEWQKAVAEFKDKLPQHAAALLELIRQE